MNEQKQQCSEMVSGEGSWGAFNQHRCHKPAIVERGGKWYCKIHDPEYIKAKSAERLARWNADREVKYKQYDIDDERERITAGLSLEELQALKPERVKASNALYEALKESLEWLSALGVNHEIGRWKELNAALKQAEGG